MDYAPQVKLSATRLSDTDSELFICDLCTAVVTNPQQHFRYHEALLHSKSGTELFMPFLHHPNQVQEQP